MSVAAVDPYKEAKENQELESEMAEKMPEEAKQHMIRLSEIAGEVADEIKANDFTDFEPLLEDGKAQVEEMLPYIKDPLEYDVLDDAMRPWLGSLSDNYYAGKMTPTTLGSYYAIKNAIMEELKKIAEP